jgi:predicted nucleotidyltransferase
VNPYAELKRNQLVEYTRDQLEPHMSVRAVVAIGSVATGQARSDSDIDAVVFMDPLDLYVAPAEAIWRPRDNSYHSIFADDASLEVEGIQLDLHRLDLATWRSAAFVWPEHTRAELADGWVVFDRTGGMDQLILNRAMMSDADRVAVLDEVLVDVEGILPKYFEETWTLLGPAEAFDRLQGAWESLARGWFAYHRRWRPWRSRSLRGLLQLDDLPESLRSAPLTAVQSTDDAVGGYARRTQALQGLFHDLLGRLTADGTYGVDPVSEAFIRLHDEPGRAWNMDNWNSQRRNAVPTRSPHR